MKGLIFFVAIFIFVFSNISYVLSQKAKEKEEAIMVLPDQKEMDFKNKSGEDKVREGKINKIRLDYTDKKISFEKAKRELFPIVKEELKDYLSNLDYQIQVLEERLEFLNKGKRNHNFLIEARIKEILGKVSPQEINLW